MKVLLLNQFFHPDLSATAQLATELAEDLVKEGFEVTALAARGSYLGALRQAQGERRLPASEIYRGIRIERVRCTSFGKRTILHRLLDYGTFYVGAAVRLLFGRRYDVVVAMSTPPLVATLGAMVRGRPFALRQAQGERTEPGELALRPRPPAAGFAQDERTEGNEFALRQAQGERNEGDTPAPPQGTRFVYWLQDVYPELAIEFGVMRAGSVAARVFERLSRWTLRRADAVVVLGEAMAGHVRAKGADPERVHAVPNWADDAVIVPVPHEANAFRRALGLDGSRVVLYSGNMGRAHDLSTILGAARALRDETGIRFVFVGDGGKRAEVEAAARELPSITLLPYQPRERLSESLSSGDVHVVTQGPGTVGLVEPSKLYGVMAAGRPVLYVGPSGTEAARTVVEERIGAVVQAGDVDAAVAAIRALLADREAVGKRARTAFDARYRRGLRTRRFAEILHALGRENPVPRSDRK